MKAKFKSKNAKLKAKVLFFTFYFLPLLSLCLGVSVANLSCRTASKTDLRTLAPAETLVYLESNDLEKTLAALTGTKAFRELAKNKPDFSRLAGTQLAVTVTGFETSEKQLTDEQAILNFKPRFVAVADTHAWERTNLALVENQLNDFVKNVYDDARLDKSEKAQAKWFTWTAGDGRRIFAAVTENLIYFGNDESALEKSLAVRRGEAENLTKNEALAREREKAADALAFGFVTPEGAAQIANLAGVSAAINSAEDDAARSFIARVLPAILQRSVKEIGWTARKNDWGIEDLIVVKTAPDVAEVFRETLKMNSSKDFLKAEFLPPAVSGVTRYDLQNPPLAWRSVLLTAAKQTDAASAEIMVSFSDSLFEPYGISDAEGFLSSVGAEIVTAKFDDEGEKTIVIADVKDLEKLKKSIADEINFKSPPEKQGSVDLWRSADKLLAAAFLENKLVLGETESVSAALKARETGANFRQNAAFQAFVNIPAMTFSYAKDAETAPKVVGVLGEPKTENPNYAGFYTTETRFAGSGFERKTVSDFGLLGTILENFSEQN